MKYLMTRLRSTNIRLLLLLDAIALPLALLLSILLRLGGEWDWHLNNGLWLLIALPLWSIPIFIRVGLYRAVIRYLDANIVYIALIGVSLSVLILISVIHFAHIYTFPKSSIIIFFTLELLYIGGSRLIARGLLTNVHAKTKVVIYGAGVAGVQICSSLQHSLEYEVVAFIDDDANKIGRVIRGITVYAPEELNTLKQTKGITQILIAMPSIAHSRKKEIIQQLAPLAINIKTLPSIVELVSGNVTINDIKVVEIEDLLGRDSVPIDNALLALLSNKLNGATVLITGAGGSIGSELARQIIALNPKKLILLDNCEFALYNIASEIKNSQDQYACSHKRFTTMIEVLGSVTNKELMHHIVSTHQVTVIYHAAAYKHVPIVEANPVVGIHNNVIGTYVVADAARRHGVSLMVLISTDKAVRPTSIMGASKRLAELIMQAFNGYGCQQTPAIKQTVFTATRFGNVLDSSGSVVPLFRKQIKAGGPVTVTHPQVIRYFMTIKEAVGLVIQAGYMATGGEVFVLDMGDPVKILDLAKRMIYLSGFSIKDANNPNGDIAITFSGLRDGEKLYEELLIGNSPSGTSHPRIFKAHEDCLEYEYLTKNLELMITLLNRHDSAAVIQVLQTLIKEYAPQY